MCPKFRSYCIHFVVKNCRHIGRTSRDELAAMNAKLTMLGILSMAQLKTTELINNTSDLLATHFAWCKRNEHWSLRLGIFILLFLYLVPLAHS